MLTRLYVEALLADARLADQVWAFWDAGEIDHELARAAWTLLLVQNSRVVRVEFGRPVGVL